MIIYMRLVGLLDTRGQSSPERFIACHDWRL